MRAQQTTFFENMSRSAQGEMILNSLANRIMELDDLIDKQNMAKEHDEEENVVSTETINEVVCEDETVCNEAESTRHFVEQMRNVNTVRKTVSDLNKFATWLKSKNEQRQLEELDSKELDQYLALFFMNAQKSNGGEYEPDTLKSIQSSINRHMKQKGLAVDIISDREFTHSREVLASKRKLLRQHGKGNRAKQAEPLTTEEIGIMYEKNLLGKANPRALVNTMYINNTLHFGMRSREEHANLRWGDVEMKASSTGERFLEFTERATKTRNGVNGGSRPYLPKMYEDNGNPRCPVMMYQEYAVRRPVSMKRDEDPFYLGVHKKCNENSEYWYVSQPMGKNTLGCIVKTMCESAGILGRKVNHSARKTAISTLVHAGVPPTLVQQHSGHKNIASINNYSTASIQQQKHMSSILCSYSSSKSTMAASVPSNLDDMPDRSSQELVESILNDIEHFEDIAPISAQKEEKQVMSNIPQPTGCPNSLQLLIHRYPHYDVEKVSAVLKSCDGDTQKAIGKIDEAMNKALDNITHTKLKSDLTPECTGDLRVSSGNVGDLRVSSGNVGMGLIGFQGYNSGFHAPLPPPQTNASPLSPRASMPMYPRAPFMYPYNPAPRFFPAAQQEVHNVSYNGDFHGTLPVPRPGQSAGDFPTSRNVFYSEGQSSMESMIGYPKVSEVNVFQPRPAATESEAEGNLVIDMKDEESACAEGLLTNYSS